MGNSDSAVESSWSEGLRILRCKAGSPAELAGLLPFQDFIVGLQNSKPGFVLTRDFSTYVAENEGKEIEILVLNCFSMECRMVRIKPSRKWESADSLLGLKIRAELIENAIHSIAKISKVTEGSPAFDAGIVADRDYLVGCVQYDYGSIEQFSDKLNMLREMEADPVIDLYIFNIGALEGSFVKVKPSNLWKGKGLLGIEFGVGLFDNRLLREALEKQARKLNPIAIDQHNVSTKDVVQPAQNEDTTVSPENDVKYFEDKDNRYVIRLSDLLPPLTFPLREYVYKA